MPLISTKGVYGLAAMLELYKSDRDIPMQIKEISSNASIPQNYLEQLFSKLRRAGFITSIRGAKGGYLLAKQVEDIIVKDILVALENDVKVVDDKASNPILDIFFAEVKEKLDEMFALNLSELFKYQDKYNQYLHYSI